MQNYWKGESEYPKILYLRNGNPLKSFGYYQGEEFFTKFFSVEKVDPNSTCVQARLLAPFEDSCGQLVLVRSENCITLDKSCLCSIQHVCDKQIVDSIDLRPCFTDCMEVTFTLPSSQKEMILWETNLDASISGELNLCITEGFEEGIFIEMTYNDYTKEAIPMKHAKKMVRVEDCHVIKIYRRNNGSKVSGEIKLVVEVC